MEDYVLNDREFKIAVVKKTQQDTRKLGQFTELKNKIKEQKEYFTKEFETLKKNQIEILELKNSINEMKNALKALEIEQTVWKRELVSSKIEIWKLFRQKRSKN